MTTTKWIGKSLTVWGALIQSLAALAPVAGWDINPEGWEIINESGVGMINAFGVVVGNILVIWGRLRASSAVTLLPKGK